MVISRVAEMHRLFVVVLLVEAVHALVHVGRGPIWSSNRQVCEIFGRSNCLTLRARGSSFLDRNFNINDDDDKNYDEDDDNVVGKKKKKVKSKNAEKAGKNNKEFKEDEVKMPARGNEVDSDSDSSGSSSDTAAAKKVELESRKRNLELQK